MSAFLLTVAVLLGGGGSPAVVTETMVELTALGVFGAAMAGGPRALGPLNDDPHWDRPWTALIIAVIALPLLQLAPVPPMLWRALPGREVAVDALAAVGKGRAWLSWSLLPDATIAALLALLPALVGALLMARLPTLSRTRLVAVLAALTVVAALVGLVQFIAGPDRALGLYADSHRGWGVGFFANRNAQADLLAIGLLAVILLADRHRAMLNASSARAGVATVVLVMLAAGVATGSRMGMAVLGVPVLLAVVLAGRRAPGIAAALALGSAVLLVGGTALDRVTARVHDAGNRAEIWGDSLFVARQVAPVGGGMGGFVPLYAAAERLDHVQPTIANRAHNDYLELAIEGGLPALAVLAAVLGCVGRRAWSGWRDADPDRRLLARFAGLAAVILAVHSMVDYPLRNLALLSIAGIALGGLASAPARPQRLARERGRGGQVYA